MQHDDRDRREIVEAYRASARLRLYAAWAAAFGALLAVGVAGATLIGWLSVEDGFTILGLALLTALVPAARFYADAMRTTVNASSLERTLRLDDDLYAGTASYRDRVRRALVAGVAVAVVSTGAVAVYSVANADTRQAVDEDDDDDDDRDGDEDGGTDDGPGDDDQPAGGGGQPSGDDDGGDDDD